MEGSGVAVLAPGASPARGPGSAFDAFTLWMSINTTWRRWCRTQLGGLSHLCCLEGGLLQRGWASPVLRGEGRLAA